MCSTFLGQGGHAHTLGNDRDEAMKPDPVCKQVIPGAPTSRHVPVQEELQEIDDHGVFQSSSSLPPTT